MTYPPPAATIVVEIIDGSFTRDLRQRVLRPEQAPDQPIPTDGIADAVHLAAMIDGALAGACAVVPEPCPWQPQLAPAWRLRSMATEPELRQQGVGRALLTHVDAFLADRGASVVWCHARMSAEAFYAANGWLGHGDVFTEHALPHRAMYRLISRVDAPTGH